MTGLDAGHFHVVEFFPGKICFIHLEGVDVFVGEGDDEPDDEAGCKGEEKIPREDGGEDGFLTGGGEGGGDVKEEADETNEQGEGDEF